MDREKGNENGALSVRLVADEGSNGSEGRVECAYAILLEIPPPFS